MRTRSIRFRLTAWYALILTAGLGLFGGLVWLSMRQRLISEVDQDLEGRADRFQNYLEREGAEQTSDRALRDELSEFCEALPPGSIVDVRSADGFAFRYVAPPEERPGNLRTLRREFQANGQMFKLEMGASVRDA